MFSTRIICVPLAIAFIGLLSCTANKSSEVALDFQSGVSLHDIMLEKAAQPTANLAPLVNGQIGHVSKGFARGVSNNYSEPELVPDLSVLTRDLSGGFDTSPSYEPRLIRNAAITEVTKVKLDASKGWAAAYFLIQSDTAGGKPTSVKVNFTGTEPVSIVPFDFTSKVWRWSGAITSNVSPIQINLYSDYVNADGYSLFLAYLPSGTCLLEKNSVSTASSTHMSIGQPVSYGLTTAKIGAPVIEDVCAIPGGGAMIAYKFQNGASTGKRVEWGVGSSPDTWSWFSTSFDSVSGIQHIRTSIIGGRLAFFMTDNQTEDSPRGSYSISDDSTGSSWSKIESIALNGIYCTEMVDNIDNVPNIMTYGANGAMNLYVRDGSASWKKLTSTLVVGEPSSIRRVNLTIGAKDPYELLVGLPDVNENNKYGISYLGDTGWTSFSYPLTTPIVTPTDGYTNIAKLTEIAGLPAIVIPGNDPKDSNKLALYYSHSIEAKGLNWTTSRRIPNTREIELDRTTTGDRYRLPHAWTVVNYNGLPIAVWVDEIQTAESFRTMRFRCAAALDTEGVQWAGPRAFGETYINPGDRVELFAIPVSDGIVVFHEWVDDLASNSFDIVFTHIPISKTAL